MNDGAIGGKEHSTSDLPKTSQQGKAKLVWQSQVIAKTYAGSRKAAMKRFQADAIEMAAQGYFPTAQSWAAGQWSGGAFAVAILLIFSFGLGIFILAYMLIIKPDGALTVTYEQRAASVEGKTRPKRAKRIKAPAFDAKKPWGWRRATDAKNNWVKRKPNYNGRRPAPRRAIAKLKAKIKR